MKISNPFRRNVDIFINRENILSKKVQRVALNAVIIANCCLVTSLFFVASKAILFISLTISIIGSSILIDRFYK